MISAKRIMACLIAFALLAQGSIAAGFMPSAKRLFAVEICTSSGRALIHLPAPDKKEHHPAKYRCPYAPVLAQNHVPPAALPGATPRMAIQPVHNERRIAVFFFIKPWLAQGPPPRFLNA
jgi:hypothetical protein